MGRMQWVSVGVGLLLVAVLYFVFDTRPPEIRKGGSGAGNKAIAATHVDVLIQEAIPSLTPAQQQDFQTLEEQVEIAVTDSARSMALKFLSSRWYGFGYPAIAGHYAAEVARIEQTARAWGIAGSTFAIGLQRATEEKVRRYCAQEAITCLERAISLDPEVVDHRLNLALVYTEMPPSDQPMRGILMLRELNQNHPENVPVLNNLGRLAIQTGQMGRAVQRLEQALALEPENPTTVCLLAQAYGALDQQAKAAQFAEQCNGLRN